MDLSALKFSKLHLAKWLRTVADSQSQSHRGTMKPLFINRACGVALALVMVPPLLSGCTPEDDSGTDAGSTGNDAGGGGGGGGASGADPGSEGGAAPTGGDSGIAGPAQCELTYLTTATTETCFNCMASECCAEMQACDQDEDCLFCIENLIDSSERCVDPQTFSVYPNRKNLDTCQTDRCVPPCGVDGGSACIPGDCGPFCTRYSNGCR